VVFLLVCLDISLNILSSSTIHFAANDGTSFFCDAQIIFHFICTAYFLYPFTADGHLGFFHILATVNSAENMCAAISLICWFHFLWMCILDVLGFLEGFPILPRSVIGILWFSWYINEARNFQYFLCSTFIFICSFFWNLVRV
jgi:hypothetical protein